MDRYIRDKRELKKKLRSDASSASIDKLKETLVSLRFLTWLDNYAKQDQLGQMLETYLMKTLKK